MRGIVNGTMVDDLVVDVTDPMVTRGDGCFEAVKAYRGTLYALDAHLSRLQRSATALAIDLPPLADVGSWAAEVAGERRDDSAVRILVSAGTGDGSTVIVFAHDLPEVLPAYRLAAVPAPWHPAGAAWELSGVKTLSYGPNMGATRVAVSKGFDDALLIGRDGQVLELPTASIVWVVNGVLETPELGLGILASVTRDVLLRIAPGIVHDVVEGVWGVERLDEATEVMVVSTTREITPVVAVDDRHYGAGDVTSRLAIAYRDDVAVELRR